MPLTVIKKGIYSLNAADIKNESTGPGFCLLVSSFCLSNRFKSKKEAENKNKKITSKKAVMTKIIRKTSALKNAAVPNITADRTKTAKITVTERFLKGLYRLKTIPRFYFMTA